MVISTVDTCPFCGQVHVMGDARTPEDCMQVNDPFSLLGGPFLHTDRALTDAELAALPKGMLVIDTRCEPDE